MKVLLFVSSQCPHCPKAEAVVKKVVPKYYERGLKFDKIRIKSKRGKDISKRFDVMAMPTILILDDEEKEVKRIVGAPTELSLKNEIEKALGVEKSFSSKVKDFLDFMIKKNQ